MFTYPNWNLVALANELIEAGHQGGAVPASDPMIVLPVVQQHSVGPQQLLPENSPNHNSLSSLPTETIQLILRNIQKEKDAQVARALQLSRLVDSLQQQNMQHALPEVKQLTAKQLLSGSLPRQSGISPGEAARRVSIEDIPKVTDVHGWSTARSEKTTRTVSVEDAPKKVEAGRRSAVPSEKPRPKKGKSSLKSSQRDVSINPWGSLGWKGMFELLRKYMRQHGHANVPRKEYFMGEPLGEWLYRQRKATKKLGVKSITDVSKEDAVLLYFINQDWTITPKIDSERRKQRATIIVDV